MGQTQTKKKLNKEARFDLKEQYFIQNGSVFLEKQLALSKGQNGRSRQLKMLSFDEIEKATNNFDPSLILGSIQSTVYKGVVDDRVVAIKVPKTFERNHYLIDYYLTEAAAAMVINFERNHYPIDYYLTEAAATMVMNHENLVKIYSCCLETFVPIMVCEYLPNGSLYKQLHSKGGCMKWCDRLRVASDTAYALSYMHNALSRPLVHRDVQSCSILLDESFRAKLSNFGYSVTLVPGKTSRGSPVLGAPGCIDPEYAETGEVTEKCDVYSFGVLLIELLTRKKPIMMAMHGTNLVDLFVLAVEKNEMIDKGMLEQAKDDEIRQVVRLALACVAKKGEERPTMISVVQQLWQIQLQKRK